MKIRNLLIGLGLSLSTLIGSTAAVADSKAEIDVSVKESLKQFYLLNPTHEELAKKAAGMLVFPRVTKGGVGIAGEYGEGVLQVKGETVTYYKISSASIGLTLGVAKHSEVIMFMTQDALDKFTASKGWSIGADTGVALVSKGAGSDYDSQTLKKAILGFVYGEKGLIADISLEGSKIDKLDKHHKGSAMNKERT